MKKAITYYLYPLLLFLAIGSFFAAIRLDWDLKIVLTGMAGTRFVVLLVVEFVYPLKTEWKMTKRSFWRDIRYMAIGGGLIGVIQLGLQLLALDLSSHTSGLLSNMPILVGTVVSMVVFEFFQYWYHRISHEGKNPLSKWLWKSHVAHHLPEEVYLLMHPVFHPINLILTQVVIQGSLLLVGARPESILLFNSLMGLQGLFSHLNVEVKAGWLNYVFIGTELHRYHHSAKLDEAKNFGALLSIWDLIFGTFEYHPERVPERLGVVSPESYPESHSLLKVMALPFQKGKLEEES